MDRIIPFNINGEQIKHYYQWDSAQKIVFNFDRCSEITDVHFCNPDSENALVVKPEISDGSVIVSVPNQLLQYAKPILIYLYRTDEQAGNNTMCSTKITVAPRPRPEDYVYSEDEVLRYVKLDERIREIEAIGVHSALTEIESRVTNLEDDSVSVIRCTPQNLTQKQREQAKANMGIELFAYNFTTIGGAMSYSPQDANALRYITENWPNAPMSIYVQGYPVIGIDINHRHLKVLKDDRFLYTFGWEVDGTLTKRRLYVISFAELVDRKYVDKQLDNAVLCTAQDFSQEQKDVILNNIGAASADIIHIVEHGVIDNWHYEKWSNGTARCWKNVTSTVKTTDWIGDSSILNFGLYWLDNNKTIKLGYPFDFAEHPAETVDIANGTAWFPIQVIRTTSGKSNCTDSYRFLTYKQPEQDMQITMTFKVEGKLE